MYKIKLLKPPRKIEDSIRRMGVAPHPDKHVVYTSTVLIHHPNEVGSYIGHFKEVLNILHPENDDGNYKYDDESNIIAGNIVSMLINWGMIELVGSEKPQYDRSFSVKVATKESLVDNGGTWQVIEKLKMTLPKLERVYAHIKKY